MSVLYNVLSIPYQLISILRLFDAHIVCNDQGPRLLVWVKLNSNMDK